MTFDYFSKNRVTYILTKLKTILDSKAVPNDIKNGKLTIQKNGTNVQTFTANQSNNATANITVPTKTSELTNDSGYITNAGVTGAKGNSETTYRTGNVNITAANIGLGNVGNFKAVSTVASQGLTDTEKSNARTNIGAGTSNFSGSYNDLSNKPTIPTVNNGTLTIQKNGTNVQTFTANQSGNATANITVPTKVSELTNDSGYTTNVGTITGIKMNGASKGTSGVVDLGTVLTSHQDISGKANTADLGDGAYKNSGVYYGTCATAAETKDKVVSVSADQKFTLKVGAVVHVKFTYSNSYSATADNKITLNVNSTGAKNIYYTTGYPTGTNTTAFGAANWYMSYMYNGTDWVWVGLSGENNTTYSAMSSSELTTGTATTSRTVRADYLKTGINSLIDTKINALDVTGASGIAASKTISAWSETDGKVSITTQDISITKSQVSDFPTSMTPTSHTHGNIQNGGTLQTNDITIASGDKLVVTDSSDSNKVARTSISFDGSTATKALTQKGTWESFTNNAGTITGIKMNGASKGTSGVVDLGTVITAHQDISGKADKSATVSTVAWDSTNKKITKTINGTTSDVVTAATILGNLTKAQVTTALGYTPPTSDTNTHRPIQVNGTEILGNNTTALNLKAGSNVSISNSSGTVTIAATDTNNRKSFYGTCSTAAATKDKVVTLAESAGWPGLVAGVIVGVKFMNTNSYSNATASPITLNVNNTGAKNIWYANNHSGAGNTGTNTTAYGRANYINYYMYDGTYWVWLSSSTDNNTDVRPSAYCDTAAGTAAKVASCSGYVLLANSYIHVVIVNTNTYAGAITLNINGKGAKPIYINGAASSSSNYALTAGSYLVFYNGTNYYFRKDGKITTAGLVNTSNSDYALTDTKVTQTASDSANADYEILFSGTADNTTRTEGVRKSGNLTYNPSTGLVMDVINSDDSNKDFAIKNNKLDTIQNNNSLTKTEYTGVTIADKNGRLVSAFQNMATTDGGIYTKLLCRQFKSDGTNVDFDLRISLDKNGNAYFYVTYPEAVRVGLDLHKALCLNERSKNLAAFYSFSSTNKLDLNTVKLANEYIANNVESANTINHPQPGVAFNLLVKYMLNSNTYLKQIIIYYNINNIYLRTSTNGGSTWTAWSPLT